MTIVQTSVNPLVFLTANTPSRRSLEKAVLLLKERGIVRMLHEAVPCEDSRQVIYEKFLSIQAVIFDLDYFGEENWEIETAKLSTRWSAVVASLAKFEHISSPETALVEVRSYMSLELAMRNGIAISNHAIDGFYQLKSCDVRLLRRLLTELAPSCEYTHQFRAAWNLLDLISEVGDDLDDMIEDQGTFNGNRILCSFQKRGVAATIDEYHDFLRRQGRLAMQLRAEIPTRCPHRRVRAICHEAIREATRLANRIARFKSAIKLKADAAEIAARRTG